MCTSVLLWTYRHRLFHPDVNVNRDKYPVMGIDVSSHNGNIDFGLLSADSVRFIIIKASEGVSHRDKKFLKNYRNAVNAGMKVGAYHYFRKGSDGEAQARNFLSVLKGTHLDMPLVIDVEDWGNDRGVSDETTKANLLAMVDYLKKRGLSCMIYTNRDGYSKYYIDIFGELPLWLCSFKNPETLAGMGHVIQQFSHWGSVDGISGEVDLNVFMGSEEAWNDWINNNQLDL